ncbi:hypothetical protein SASPL_121999 [Salvia splendens]|uniref:W2 domain-containing protein n=1 Tax=Salvia splendens TaxID=180675 RepID=A0A8X8ZS13_SALSN|nr:hypothetical protein SASPL_121999 [Salvia splendens]
MSSYLVKIEDGCRLKHAIVCDGVTMKSGVVLEAGTVLSFNVVIGQDFVVPAYLKVSLLQQPVRQDSDSDEELEYLYAGYTSGNVEITSVSDLQMQAASEVGGAGFIWPVGEEEWRHSMAPIPAVEMDISSAESTSGEVGLDSDDGGDDYACFEKEITDAVIEIWGKLLKCYLPSIDEEIEVLLKFEEMCLESTTEYAYLFPKILRFLYDKGILQEDGILCWASEKEHADESDKVFVKKADEFLQRLKERREKED